MKTLTKKLKIVALFFATLILFQGCTVYKSVPVSIEQAVQNGSKVKVITKSYEKFKFSKIEIEDGNYYGVKKSKGEMIKTQIDEQNVEKVQLKDKTLSTIITIVVPSFTLIGLLALILYGDMIGGYSNGFQ